MRNKFKAFFGIVLLFILCCYRVGKYCDWQMSVCSAKEHILETPAFMQKIDPALEKVRQYATSRARKYLPSPHSELLLGMVVGLDYFSKLPFFKEMLIATGTIHVVVVSGFNISLVYSLVWKALGSFYDRTKLILGVIVALLYAGLSGFEPPVVRSWIMGSLAYLGKHYGRSFPALQLVFISALAMLLWQPAYLFSLSFQLSLSATLSLLLFTEIVEQKVFFAKYIPSLFREDFITTLAAQILVWPILSYYFGRISIISILVNTLVLWTVPIGTILGGAFLLTFFLGEVGALLLAFVVYIPLDLFVNIIQFFSDLSENWGISQVDWQISGKLLFTYYLVLVGLLIRRNRKAHLAGASALNSGSATSVDITTSHR
jgi:competence protein ComEC